MKNTLLDLNNHLFMELERLGDEDLSEDKIDFEVSRARALSSVADRIIHNASLMLDAKKHFDECSDDKNKKMPKFLSLEYGNDK